MSDTTTTLPASDARSRRRPSNQPTPARSPLPATPRQPADRPTRAGRRRRFPHGRHSRPPPARLPRTRPDCEPSPVTVARAPHRVPVAAPSRPTSLPASTPHGRHQGALPAYGYRWRALASASATAVLPCRSRSSELTRDRPQRQPATRPHEISSRSTETVEQDRASAASQPVAAMRSPHCESHTSTDESPAAASTPTRPPRPVQQSAPLPIRNPIHATPPPRDPVESPRLLR